MTDEQVTVLEQLRYPLLDPLGPTVSGAGPPGRLRGRPRGNFGALRGQALADAGRRTCSTALVSSLRMWNSQT